MKNIDFMPSGRIEAAKAERKEIEMQIWQERCKRTYHYFVDTQGEVKGREAFYQWFDSGAKDSPGRELGDMNQLQRLRQWVMESFPPCVPDIDYLTHAKPSDSNIENPANTTVRQDEPERKTMKERAIEIAESMGLHPPQGISAAKRGKIFRNLKQEGYNTTSESLRVTLHNAGFRE